MRYLVKDEEGKALRMFWTKQEAVAFASQGETIEKISLIPKATVEDLINEVGEARW